jgi:hypothetical protein
MAPHAKKAVSSQPIPFWIYSMISGNAQVVNAFLTEVRESKQPFSALAVWFAIAAHLELDTGVLTCSQRQLAKTAGMNVGEVNRALDILVKMGTLIREERGRYRVHPSVMWRGQLALRGQAEETAPRLTLVEGGRED